MVGQHARLPDIAPHHREGAAARLPHGGVHETSPVFHSHWGGTGDLLDARAEGYINDDHVPLPTGDSALQVMYLTITDGALVPIAASALLRTP